MFDVVDMNHDGVISLEEWQYAALYFHYCSGPEDPLSELFGAIPDQ